MVCTKGEFTARGGVAGAVHRDVYIGEEGFWTVIVALTGNWTHHKRPVAMWPGRQILAKRSAALSDGPRQTDVGWRPAVLPRLRRPNVVPRGCRVRFRVGRDQSRDSPNHRPRRNHVADVHGDPQARPRD